MHSEAIRGVRMGSLEHLMREVIICNQKQSEAVGWAAWSTSRSRCWKPPAFMPTRITTKTFHGSPPRAPTCASSKSSASSSRSSGSILMREVINRSSEAIRGHQGSSSRSSGSHPSSLASSGHSVKEPIVASGKWPSCSATFLSPPPDWTASRCVVTMRCVLHPIT